MAETAPPPAKDKDLDLRSLQEARTLARAARAAQLQLAEFSQQQIDAVVDAMAAAVAPEAESLARLAVEETGFGVVADKVAKNRFAAEEVYRAIRSMKTVGVVNRVPDRRLVEIAEPFGVVAAIIPSTNPTSTAIYKVLIAIKARCAIVLSPHPAAVRCITRTADLMHAAAVRAGLPSDAIGCMKVVTLEGTQELMRQREVAVILATGGMGLVRAAYSAGKPAYGVGPGNAPAYIERTADVPKAVRDIITGKTFDNGVLCSSENSVVVDEPIVAAVREEFVRQGGYFLEPGQADALARLLVTPQRLPNPLLVGKSALFIAEKAGFQVPAGTRVLIAPLEGVGRDHPLSIEKLCPVLSFYVVKDWRDGCERCKEILRYGGMGHTMAIHSRDEDVILQFGLHKPAFRIVVNTPTTLGSIGMTTGLDPALTLGCGGFGGNITSDNIGPRHLLNIKRLAYETRPVAEIRSVVGSGSPSVVGAGLSRTGAGVPSASSAEAAAEQALRERIDAFLRKRGYRPDGPPASGAAAPTAPPSSSSGAPRPDAREAGAPSPGGSDVMELDFVSEEDVRKAIARAVKIRLKPRAIVTPAASDLAATRDVILRPGE